MLNFNIVYFKIFDNDFSRLDENFKVIEKTSRRFSSDLEEYLTSLKVKFKH